MLFRQRFHAGIQDGSVTRTVRAWDKARATVGATHRLGPRGTIEIRRVDSVTLASLTNADAKRSGFASREALVDELERTTRRRLTGRSRVFRIDFRWVAAPDPRKALQRKTSAADLDELNTRLDGMDRRSRRGPWTREVLRCIERHPRVAAARLAPRFGRETRAFKADVRKLKELGLTVSHEVGYSLSPRGKAVLRHIPRPTAPTERTARCR